MNVVVDLPDAGIEVVGDSEQFVFVIFWHDDPMVDQRMKSIRDLTVVSLGMGEAVNVTGDAVFSRHQAFIARVLHEVFDIFFLRHAFEFW